MRETAAGSHGGLNRTQQVVRVMRAITLRPMAARTAVMGVSVIGTATLRPGVVVKLGRVRARNQIPRPHATKAVIDKASR
jgi:hypothetical protein